MEWLKYFNFAVAVLFSLCYAYQYIYIIVGCICKPVKFPDVKPRNRFAVIISARNEEKVIGNLIESIKRQDYPSELLDIYVVADNCTDNTKGVCEKLGAYVYERFDSERVGKGYALNFLFGKIFEKYSEDYYDGYFIIDADNLLDEHYISEMNKCFSAGHRIITSYRNSKNYAANWISSGYALWFLREGRHLNNPRFILGTSCAVSGTGFLVHRDIIKRQHGWKHFLLTEDIEFSIDNVLHGEKIAYCHSAMIYDEQPTTFSQSWTQRLRWSKGFLQVIKHYGSSLIKAIFCGNGFSNFDMLFTIAPAFVISTLSIVVNVAGLIYGCVIRPVYAFDAVVETSKIFFGVYFVLFAVGLITGIFEWKNIYCSTGRKIWSFFTFPIFMITYIPISLAAFFSKVKWKPIEHTQSVKIEDLKK